MSETKLPRLDNPNSPAAIAARKGVEIDKIDKLVELNKTWHHPIRKIAFALHGETKNNPDNLKNPAAFKPNDVGGSIAVEADDGEIFQLVFAYNLGSAERGARIYLVSDLDDANPEPVVYVPDLAGVALNNLTNPIVFGSAELASPEEREAEVTHCIAIGKEYAEKM